MYIYYKFREATLCDSVYMYKYICIRIYKDCDPRYVCMYISKDSNVKFKVCVCARMCVFVYVCACIYKYVHTYTDE